MSGAATQFLPGGGTPHFRCVGLYFMGQTRVMAETHGCAWLNVLGMERPDAWVHRLGQNRSSGKEMDEWVVDTCGLVSRGPVTLAETRGVAERTQGVGSAWAPVPGASGSVARHNVSVSLSLAVSPLARMTPALPS